MRKTYKAGLSALLWMFLCLPALGQEATPPEGRDQLLKFAANNAAFDTRVKATARELYRRQITDCTAADQIVRQIPTPYGAMTFPQAKPGDFPAPVSGLWAEHVKIRGCGKIWQVNMLGIGQSGADPLIFALMPGDTLSDPGEQRKAERLGAAAVKKSDDACADTPLADNTRMLGYRQANGGMARTDAGLGWFEQWTYKFCQKTVPVQLAFVPDGSGGNDIKARLIGAAPAKLPEAKPAQAATASPAAPATTTP